MKRLVPELSNPGWESMCAGLRSISIMWHFACSAGNVDGPLSSLFTSLDCHFTADAQNCRKTSGVPRAVSSVRNCSSCFTVAW